MAMVRIELRDAAAEPRDVTAPLVAMTRPRPSMMRTALPYLGAVSGLVVAGVATWWLSRPADVSRAVARFSIELSDQAQSSAANQIPVAISPDGTHLVYVTSGRLYLRALRQLDAMPIAGTDAIVGAGDFAGVAPSFSPDGQWIAFWQQQQLKKVAVSGGSPVTICHEVFFQFPYGTSWGPDGEILWGAPGAVMRVPATGGSADSLIALGKGERAADPQALPGGEWVLFVVHQAGVDMDQGQIVAQSRATGERRVLIDGARSVQYVRSGHLVFGRGNSLLAQAFDAKRLTLSDGAVAVIDRVARAEGFPSTRFAVSSTGTLLYVSDSQSATPSARLVQIARDGTRSTLAEVAGIAWFPRVSPDGSRVVFGVSAGSELSTPADLWVLDRARGAQTRITFGGNNRFIPVWTPDGTRVTYADATLAETTRLLTALADGSGGIQTLFGPGPRRFPTSWSRDGRTLAIYGPGVNSTRDLRMLQVDGDKRTDTGFVETPFEERGAIFSPDGRWVAYVSNKSGRNDVYARPYPGPGGEVTLSVGGGQEPVWAPSGGELFYRRDGQLLVVRIEQTATLLTAGAPTVVFDDPYKRDVSGTQGGVANYDIAPTGEYFVMLEEVRHPSPSRTPPEIHVVLNWHEELKRLVPTK